MKGFFQKEIKITNKKSKGPCEVCGLYKKCLSPKMDYTGEGKLGILIISEAPGRTEDEKGIQLIGEAGQVLRKRLEKFGLDLDRDFYKENSVNCRPPNNRKPTRKELKCCRFKVEKAIEETKPKHIWLLGGAAVESFYQGYFKDLTINRWRGLSIPDPITNAWIFPMFHPSYLLRNQYDENLSSVFDRDIEKALNFKEELIFPEIRIKKETDFNSLYRRLKDIFHHSDLISFDYEATNLKPFSEEQKIWTIGVAPNPDEAFAFPLEYPHWEEKEKKTIYLLWKSILKSEKIKKIAHNLKFEDLWSREIFKLEVKGWLHCTMNAAHIEDNRQKYSGLKFQSYIKYGVYPYDLKVKKFIKTFSATSVNSLDQVPLSDLLTYNGTDALIPYWLYRDQNKSFGRGLKKAYSFFHEGLLSLSEIQSNGIHVDKKYYVNYDKRLGRKIIKMEKKLTQGEEARKFKKVIGRELNLRSDKDLRDLFFKVMKKKAKKITEKGFESVDKEALGDMDVPFVRKLLRLRKIEKIKGTYLAQFLREVVDGKIHPFFDLNTTRTFRSSASRLNFQNIPVRDEESKKITRTGIIPSLGNKICEVDYSSIEVRIAACYNKDESLIKYVTDPSTDMHRDSAMDIWKLPEKEVSKPIRFYAKNNWVFPQFYGDWYKSCARSLWENCLSLEINSGMKLKDHLKEVRLHIYPRFEQHCKKVEDIFWNERFSQYKKWKERINQEYRRKGYIETFLGFRFQGYMSRKDVTNYPIQGTAFHCLLWSLIQIHKLFKKKNWNSKIIGQIHDSIVFDLDPKEEQEILLVVKYIMEKKIRKTFDWIIVPLEAEFEMTPIDGSWYQKKEIKV